MTPTPGVLDPDELRDIAERFGVADEQVRRDHLISHVLAAIEGVNGVVFVGGTALTRTVLPELRLSEDIDLIAVRQRSAVVRDLATAIERGLARSFGEVRWEPPIDATRDAQPTALAVPGPLSVQVQVVTQEGRAALPTQRRAIVQRYSDATSVVLETLTDAGFGAAKISAWLDRAAARDLFDLHALADAGVLTAEASELVRTTTNWSSFPRGVRWPSPPSEEDWVMQLAHQTRLHVGADAAHRRVVSALERTTR